MIGTIAFRSPFGSPDQTGIAMIKHSIKIAQGVNMRPCSHSFSSDLLSLKTASYALMHFCVAIAVAYALTLDWRKALAIGILEPFVQTFAFTLHDRYWRNREALKTQFDMR